MNCEYLDLRSEHVKDVYDTDELFSYRNLAHNKLSGPLPDLTSMDTLNYV